MIDKKVDVGTWIPFEERKDKKLGFKVLKRSGGERPKEANLKWPSRRSPESLNFELKNILVICNNIKIIKSKQFVFVLLNILLDTQLKFHM